MKPTVHIPKSNSDEKEELGSERNLVLIGPNGSGKSKLGAWIEEYRPNYENLESKIIHRVSAQRALDIPKSITMRPLNRSKNLFLWGEEDPRATNDIPRKFRTRWAQKPTTHLINDINYVMSALFAEQRKRDKNYTEESKLRAENQELTLKPPLSLIDIMKEICDDIFPYMSLNFADEMISVNTEGTDSYIGSEMSDGERVAIYLIGQCLLIPENSVIIIDEPDIHLHKSLMSRLWNKIEEIKNDCLFIYITHDLDFASSRNNADKLWIKKYIHPNKWEWEFIPQSEEIPENLMLRIIGNRKNVIFTEGDLSSLDYKIYQKIYDGYFIVPVGGYQNVINSVKGMRNNPSLHYLNAYGIIDRDYRNDEEIRLLQSSNIYCLKVALIENLLCTENVIRIISQHLHQNHEEIFQEVRAFILEELENNFERQVSRYTAARIQSKLRLFNIDAVGKVALNDTYETSISAINVSEIYEESASIFQLIIDNADYENLLKFFKEKSLLKRISPKFGLNLGEYEELIVRLLFTEKKNDLVNAFREYLPEFS